MSTLWTPSGERPIPRPTARAEQPQAEPRTPAPKTDFADVEPDEAEIRELRDRLASTPPEVMIANNAFMMCELAGMHLSSNPPRLSEARLCIDALGCLVEGLGPRLGPPAAQLGEILSELRMAYVQLAARHGAPAAQAGEADDSPAG